MAEELGGKGGPAKEARTSGRHQHLGGARADFVASVGRKVADLRDVLSELERQPQNKAARDDLRRKLHALGTGAKLLRFDAMTRALQEAGAVVERAAQSGALHEEERRFVLEVLDDLPALAWGDAPPRTREPPGVVDGPAQPSLAKPFAVLVVGPESLAEALLDDGAVRGGRSFECERTEESQAAIGLARAFAPDIVLVDADLDSAPELVEALLDDPLTEPVPIVVVGSFRAPEQSARFVALGVAKTFAKPFDPELLRQSCDEIIDQRDGKTMRLTLGEPTLEQLAERLAEEVKRGLLASVDAPARSSHVPLGEGTEVMGAIWGAIARVQEVVSAKTGGAVRFGGDAPEGAIALAPWLHHDLPGMDRTLNRARGAASEVRLDRRRVVVADDDPGVTWFISDLLRTGGCEVHEALDGKTALDLALKVSPELVVSDILMPGLDGFALCRALRRDVALRDTPVILLSWKEDLLQRVRELGASAAAYLKKESDARAILARVREVLRPRARIEARLKGEGEVRGRLDGLTPRLLLELVGAIRKDARVAVRDATFLYEVELRDGAPRRITRTGADGAYQRGERVLASLLGVGAGRFVVSAAKDQVKAELAGTLAQQLARPIAMARGAVAATTGAHTLNVERIVLDEVALEDYLGATPEPARDIIRRIAKGASPRQMLLAGEVAPSLLEDVLCDLAVRGAVTVVRAPNGSDLLTPAVEEAFAVLEGTSNERRATLPPNARASFTPPPPVNLGTARVAPGEDLSSLVAARASAPPRRDTPPYESLKLSEPPPVPPSEEGEAAPQTPSSLEDAVMRELSDRSPGGQRSSSPGLPAILDPNVLRPRSSSNPPPTATAAGTPRSLPPDAVVPAASSDEMPASRPAPTPSIDVEMVEAPPSERAPGAAAAASVELSEKTEVDETSYGEHGELAPQDEHATNGVSGEPPQRTPLSSSVGTSVPPPAPSKRGLPWVRFAALVVVGLGVGIALGWTVESASPSGSSAAANAPPPNDSIVAAGPAPSASLAANGQPPSTRPEGSFAPPTFADVPQGADVGPGQGWLEVVTSPDARIRIDGELRGRGEKLGVAIAPGFHELELKAGSKTLKQAVEVRPGRATHVDASVLGP